MLAIDPQAMSRLMRIGHSLWAIVFAVAGGLLARECLPAEKRGGASPRRSGS